MCVFGFSIQYSGFSIKLRYSISIHLVLEAQRSFSTGYFTWLQVNYGLDGWVGHHNVDIWGQTAPVAEDPVWALWPVGGAWLSLHLWEHYSFSLDKVSRLKIPYSTQ